MLVQFSILLFYERCYKYKANIYLIMKSNQNESKLFPLRKSSALILLYPYQNSYKTLLLKRKSTMSFSSRYVFPGGVCDQQDKSMIKGQPQFQQYSKFTALRQFLQQTGLLVYPANKAHIVEDRDFINKTIKEITAHLGDIWEGSLGYIQPVLRLMTPQEQKGKRYDCMFNICRINPNIKVLNLSVIKQNLSAIVTDEQLKQLIQKQEKQEMANLIFNKDESDDYAFDTPTQIVKGFLDNKIQLAPPQVIIFKCLIELLKAQNSKQLAKLSSSLKTNYFDRIEPIMFQFDIQRMILRLFGDRNYNNEKLITNEPESESKQDIKTYIDQQLTKIVKSKGVRSIKLGKSIKLLSTYPQWQSKLLFKFFPVQKQKLQPKL